MSESASAMSKRRVVYLTWGETPRSIGVYGSQVVEQLQHLNATPGSLKLLAGLPIVHSGLFRERWDYTRELERIRRKLGAVEFQILPIYAPQTFIYSGVRSFWFFYGISLLHLVRALRKALPEVVHCRSYHATFAALQARRRGNLSYRVIFDARGLFPEEVAFKRGLSDEHPDYLFLKQLERRLLTESEMTVSVSYPMTSHYQKLGVARCTTIHLSAPVDELSHTCRSRLNGTTTLCYLGALAHESWHKPGSLFQLYSVFRARVRNPRLLILTTSNAAEIMTARGTLPLEEIEVRSVRSREQLIECLSRADVGALPFLVPSTPMERAIADTLFGVKTAEYLAAGLPVLVNRYCGGAAELVARNRVGIIYDPLTFEGLTTEAFEGLLDESVSARAKEVARQYFDYSLNAARYRALYDNVAER